MSSKSKMFTFIYLNALHDAVLQKSFDGTRAWISKVTEAETAVRKYIDSILEFRFTSPAEHDAAFLETAKAVCKAINAEGEKLGYPGRFSFGNAQKLINMTVKHFYIICYQNPELKNNFQYCHCPMDSIMLDHVWKKYVTALNHTREERSKMLTDTFLSGWGHNDFENGSFPVRYLQFQSLIRELGNTLYSPGISPVEYDYCEWN